jgi:peptide-methionine (S)-S-oxide reductase
MNMMRSLVIAGAIVAIVVAISAVQGSKSAAREGAFPNPAVDDPLSATKGHDSVVFAGGCFWGVQAVFEHVKGVVSAMSGYAGGSVKNPSYEEVSMGTTGHAESVEIVYDPSQISFGMLLKVFFSVAHDPTELNRQGPDSGTQYRSAIFYANENQRRIAQAYIDQLNQAKIFSRPIATQVVAFGAFYPAEDYHQDYFFKHPASPYIVINDAPKVRHLREQLPELYRRKGEK